MNVRRLLFLTGFVAILVLPSLQLESTQNITNNECLEDKTKVIQKEDQTGDKWPQSSDPSEFEDFVAFYKSLKDYINEIHPCKIQSDKTVSNFEFMLMAIYVIYALLDKELFYQNLSNSVVFQWCSSQILDFSDKYGVSSKNRTPTFRRFFEYLYLNIKRIIDATSIEGFDIMIFFLYFYLLHKFSADISAEKSFIWKFAVIIPKIVVFRVYWFFSKLYVNIILELFEPCLPCKSLFGYDISNSTLEHFRHRMKVYIWASITLFFPRSFGVAHDNESCFFPRIYESMDDTFNILERVNILLIGFLALSSCKFSFSNVGYFLLFLGIYVYVPKHSDVIFPIMYEFVFKVFRMFRFKNSDVKKEEKKQNSDAKQVKNDKNSHLKEEKTDENSGVGKEKKKDENGQNNPNPIAPT